MGGYKSVWSCDRQLCKNLRSTIIAWETEGNFGAQQKDTGQQISRGWGERTNVHTRVTRSTNVLQVHDHVQLEVQRNSGKCDHRKTGGSRQEVRKYGEVI